VRDRQRFLPIRPAALGLEAGLDPLAEIGRAGERLDGEVSEALVGEPFRQRIDRLAVGELVGLVGVEDVVRVNDLKLLAVAVELARDEPWLADRVLLLRPARIAEISERHIIAARIHRVDAHGTARPRRLPVFARSERDGDDAAHICGIEPLHALAVDPAGREVKQQVDDAREAEPLQRLHQLRPDPLQNLHFGEERVEQLRAHD